MTEGATAGAGRLLGRAQRVGRGCPVIMLLMLCSAAGAEGGLPGGLKTVQATAGAAHPVVESARPEPGHAATNEAGGAIYSPFAAGNALNARAPPAVAARHAPEDDGGGWPLAGIAVLSAAGAAAAWSLRARSVRRVL